jgi:hypothetical protein
MPPCDYVLDLEQLVLLDLGDPGGHPRHAGHGFVIGGNVRVPLWGKDVQGHRQSEAVGAAAFGE